jgi:hypothetical protein
VDAKELAGKVSTSGFSVQANSRSDVKPQSGGRNQKTAWMLRSLLEN